MSLYSYSLYLVRESDRGSLIEDLQVAGLVRRRAPGDDIELLGQVAGTSTSIGGGRETLEICPDDTTFDRFLRDRGNELVPWLWTAFEQVGVLYAFIPVGGDHNYDEDGVSIELLAFRQLPELVETGTVRVVHPLVMFATRLGGGRPCERAKTLQWGLTEHRDGIGCLLALAETTENGFILLEPGTMYPALRNEWR